MTRFLLGVMTGLVLSVTMAVAQFYDPWKPHQQGLTPEQQQQLFNLQMQLNTMPHAPGQPPALIPVMPPC